MLQHKRKLTHKNSEKKKSKCGRMEQVGQMYAKNHYLQIGNWYFCHFLVLCSTLHSLTFFFLCLLFFPPFFSSFLEIDSGKRTLAFFFSIMFSQPLVLAHVKILRPISNSDILNYLSCQEPIEMTSINAQHKYCHHSEFQPV